MKQKLILALSFSLSFLNAMERELFFPTDLAQHLCIYGTESLNDAGKLISSFIQTNQTLKNSLNDSSICLYIIKKLSAQFDYSNEKVAETLRIKASRQRLYLQNTFLSYCSNSTQHPDNNTLKSRFTKLEQDNVDFEFTYGESRITGLMRSLCPHQANLRVTEYLILHGVNLYTEIKNGSSAYSLIFAYHPHLIPFLLEHKKLEPNKTNGKFRQTPLINLIMFLGGKLYPNEKTIKIIEEGVQILLDAGADPELKNQNNKSAHSVAHEKKDTYPQFVTFMEEAIRKKHALQKSEQ